MEQNFNQASASTEASTKSIFKKTLTIIIALIFVVALVLAGIGWYIQRTGNKGLTDAEREQMIRALGTSTPLTAVERKQMVSALGTSTPLTDQEREQMLKALK
ncbi:MAG: hypothetical protein WCW56_00195 [Candidatus Paceibacterota bacterium]|jgi:flagellar biogenesis protein FliO